MLEKMCALANKTCCSIQQHLVIIVCVGKFEQGNLVIHLFLEKVKDKKDIYSKTAKL